MIAVALWPQLNWVCAPALNALKAVCLAKVSAPNVDLVTLALNLYSQGIDPCLKLSDIDRVRHECEVVTRMEVGPREPLRGGPGLHFFFRIPPGRYP